MLPLIGLILQDLTLLSGEEAIVPEGEDARVPEGDEARVPQGDEARVLEGGEEALLSEKAGIGYKSDRDEAMKSGDTIH